MLEAFLSESRDNLETAGKCFLALEDAPNNKDIMDELFRAVHTIKGSSGLFDIHAFTQVVHVAEDILDNAREGALVLDSGHIDTFLDAFDQVNAWLDELENQGSLASSASETAAELIAKLNQIMPVELPSSTTDANNIDDVAIDNSQSYYGELPSWFSKLPQDQRLKAYLALDTNSQLFSIDYTPDAACFFSGDDPLHFVSNLPGLQWFSASSLNPWPDLLALDPFSANLNFQILVTSDNDTLQHHLRYIPEQVEISMLCPSSLINIQGEMGDLGLYEEFCKQAELSVVNGKPDELLRNISTLLSMSGDELYQTQALHWLEALIKHKQTHAQDLGTVELALIRCMLSGELALDEPPIKPEKPNTKEEHGSEDESEALNQQIDNLDADKVDNELLTALLETQVEMLSLSDLDAQDTRLSSVQRILNAALPQALKTSLVAKASFSEKLVACSKAETITIIQSALEKLHNGGIDIDAPEVAPPPLLPSSSASSEEASSTEQQVSASDISSAKDEKTAASKVLRVDQHRIDTLMDLVGELIVAKNALPFLAKKAEEEFDVRPLAKEIKSQYAAINRLSDELQAAVMQIRMVPMSTVFQRFPRLVRDLARKLDKKIKLVLEGEETEADKNVVEELADPLIHLIRNSLDHGLEMPSERVALGKSEQGTITLRAIPKDDQVIIEVCDDGKGIDPNIIKRKAYEKGVIDEERLESISDHEALQLIFAAGFSTAEQVSDLSGRGVGMDVVRTVIQQSGGSVVALSEVGQGSTMRLTLPLSMAVTRVMMLEVSKQLYGISMDNIVETVRVPISEVQGIKRQKAIVLRDRLIPLFDLRTLLEVDDAEQSDELAVLVMHHGDEEIGLVIDEFHEGIDIIQKPLEGVMAGYSFYSGTALLGDGRVLLVLNIPELIACQ
ncbi:chemotaxis protein CheA [Glaciecola sp. MH2013]|uniref:chemotaxis protein CheA n=1 Tax=Glaciecola sp. MH2013 TaxID=2785524 RepID=UPI001E4C62C6|nr:chemotaxis protein CheA [Glaciecola sp. MH2013]